MASILTCGTMSLPLRVLEEGSSYSSSSNGDPTDAVVFVGISLVLGIACRHALRGTRVPYTIALLVLGIGVGALEYGTHHHLGKIGNGIRLWADVDPDLLLAVFLPALLFESSFSMEVHQIKRCMMQMFLLAGPGVVISTFFLGATLKLLFPYNWSWKTSLLLGGLLSATDPVAAVALLKDLGASKKLSTIIEGESLMNDGTAIVVFQLFYRMVLGWSFSWGALIKFLSQVSIGAIGLAFGISSVLWLGFIFNDTVIEISLTLAVSYIAYFTGEMVAYIANTLIFILSGVVIAESILKSESIFGTHEHSWGYLFLLYVLVQVARVVVVGVLFPFLQYFGYGLDWKEAMILVWSGLRGAVALSLSLSVKRSSDRSSYISSDTGSLFVFLTGGIVFLTLIVNGSTTQLLLHALKMDKLSAAKRRILNYTKSEMLNKALEAFGNLGEDEELGPADWTTVKRYIKSLNDVDGEQIHPHSTSENDDTLEHMNLKDIRMRFLNGVQAAYWVMLDEGRITQTTANLLMRSVDEAIDLISHEALCDWKGLKSYVKMPNYYKFLQSSVVPPKLVTYFTVERLESACYICAAFLRAHRIARQQLHDFIGDSGIAAVVIRESEQEGEEARKFLEDVRVTFPQVLRVVKTRQATYSVLNHLIDYVNNLEKIGLLEKKEMIHLHDAVQTDLKRLLRNPPLVKTPKVRDMISANPFLGALPSVVLETLVGSTKEMMKLSGSTLYREGSKPAGIWLISNGVVKWSSKSNKHLLHPAFTHGSTLGLYEVLSEKPYICDIITDSVVLCFFIATENIFSALRYYPAVEDFFWQESIIVLAKLMLPHIFEKMSMPDFRTLIAERSTMNIYVRGESFEILQHFIGFLLEGFVRIQGGQERLLSAPATILPCVGQSFRQSETLDHRARDDLEALLLLIYWRLYHLFFWSHTLSFSEKCGSKAESSIHQVSVYQVETRARVMILDMAGFEATITLQKRPSALISHSVYHPSGSLGRERGGLMSWPKQMSKSKYHDGEVPYEQANNLSARAMQLSIFGSMINMRGQGTRSSPRNRRIIRPTHSVSYPSVPTFHARPMYSVKSEGPAMLGTKLDTQENNKKQSSSQYEKWHLNRSHEARDDSSDESGCEDEHIVRIDSPSKLFFRQNS
ncbi:Son of sevenless 1 [Orobanche gracilis]